jgi:hypothetical protein
MAASIKVSELQTLTSLTDVDLFLVSDMETGTSRRVSYSDLKTNLLTDTANALAVLEGVVDTDRNSALIADTAQVEALEFYKTYIEDRNLAAGLSLGMLYVENFTGG